MDEDRALDDLKAIRQVMERPRRDVGSRRGALPDDVPAPSDSEHRREIRVKANP